LANKVRKAHDKRRSLVQLLTAIITNAYIIGFIEGKIFQGGTKAFCVPGLNCYACPGALGSCPIGSLQAVLGSRGKSFSFYIVGYLMAVGAASGRFVCGWLCPFGYLQDLLYKIPLLKKFKMRRLPGEKYIEKLRYLLLVVFVLLIPLFVVDFLGQGSPAFCTYICPSGTISGLLLMISNEGLRSAVGWLFAWKNLILAIVVILSIFLYRPFCRYMCPLGAIYGLFNPIALYRFKIDEEKCTKCKICQKACKLDIPTYLTPNSTACIRCGDCIAACPHDAIIHGTQIFKTRGVEQTESNYPL
jgi:polyferredoxin